MREEVGSEECQTYTGNVDKRGSGERDQGSKDVLPEGSGLKGEQGSDAMGQGYDVEGVVDFGSLCCH